MARIAITDLAAVVYSSGKVFDGLQTGRLATEEFLRTGDTTAVNSMQDLALLRDLKAAASLVIAHPPRAVTTTYLKQLNSSMTRSASLEPGVLRRNEDGIGVGTLLGRHEPPEISAAQLDARIKHATGSSDPQRNAASLFLAIAKAQPFKDGNKRTGIFAANTLLLTGKTGSLLTVPFSEDDPTVAQQFNEKLARAYLFNEDAPVIESLLEQGIAPVAPRPVPESAKMRELKTKVAQRAALIEPQEGSFDDYEY